MIFIFSDRNLCFLVKNNCKLANSSYVSLCPWLCIELYEYCLRENIADKNLIAKWKKPGYENVCCLRCIQKQDTNFGTNCVCRVPKTKLEEVCLNHTIVLLFIHRALFHRNFCIKYFTVHYWCCYNMLHRFYMMIILQMLTMISAYMWPTAFVLCFVWIYCLSICTLTGGF